MERHEFNITIEAGAEVVWDTLWNDKTYSLWTAPFAEGSIAESDWKEGSQIIFKEASGAPGCGMVALIARKIPNQLMSFVHQGSIDKGEQKDESWKGAEENYHLTEADGKTRLLVEMDIEESHKDYFLEVWPKALDALKGIAEGR